MTARRRIRRQQVTTRRLLRLVRGDKPSTPEAETATETPPRLSAEAEQRLGEAIFGPGYTPPSDDERLVDHIYATQIEPQLAAAEFRAAGHDVDMAMVNTNPDAIDGYEVACCGCGRTARLPFVPPADRVLMCPDCQRLHRGKL